MYLTRFDALFAELVQLADSNLALGDAWAWSKVAASQHAAAAFGYALMRSESELETRPAKRLHPVSQRDAGRAGALKRRQDADEWRQRAVPIATVLRAKHPDMSTSRLAAFLWRELEEPKPKEGTISRWISRLPGLAPRRGISPGSGKKAGS